MSAVIETVLGATASEPPRVKRIYIPLKKLVIVLKAVCIHPCGIPPKNPPDAGEELHENQGDVDARRHEQVPGTH